MVNSLSNQRKEIAEKLREIKEECNQRGYPWMVEDLMRALGFLSYEDADDQIFDRLADLIDPTCEINKNSDGYGYSCSRCNSFASPSCRPCVNGYCMHCGARVVSGND